MSRHWETMMSTLMKDTNDLYGKQIHKQYLRFRASAHLEFSRDTLEILLPIYWCPKLQLQGICSRGHFMMQDMVVTSVYLGSFCNGFTRMVRQTHSLSWRTLYLHSKVRLAWQAKYRSPKCGALTRTLIQTFMGGVVLLKVSLPSPGIVTCHIDKDQYGYFETLACIEYQAWLWYHPIIYCCNFTF